MAPVIALVTPASWHLYADSVHEPVQVHALKLASVRSPCDLTAHARLLLTCRLQEVRPRAPSALAAPSSGWPGVSVGLPPWEAPPTNVGGRIPHASARVVFTVEAGEQLLRGGCGHRFGTCRLMGRAYDGDPGFQDGRQAQGFRFPSR